MSRKRCFIPNPEQPGSLQLLTITLDSHCAPFQETCLLGAMAKWLPLFTIQILAHTVTEMGVILLAYIPNLPITMEEAKARSAQFDTALREQHKGSWPPKGHDYSPEKLNSLSDFMRVFVRDFMARHKKIPPPAGLPEGYNPLPRKKERYKAKTVQHDALPPIFNERQLDDIHAQLLALGFTSEVQAKDIRDLYLSPHGIGTRTFLEKLEAWCHAYLASRQGKDSYLARCPGKRIVPFDPEVWERRLGELALLMPYAHHPKVWDALQGIGSLKTDLLNPESFRQSCMDLPVSLDGMVLSCLPMTLSLMLADGFLRWYYKTCKGVEFPIYDHYDVQPPGYVL